MYDADPLPGADELSPGTTLLVLGPPTSGKREFALDLLAGDDDVDAGTALVATDESGATVWEEYAALSPVAETDRVGVVDASGRAADPADDAPVTAVRSPADLTAIGVETTDLIRTFTDERGLDRVRAGVLSLNPLATHADATRALKFLHAFVGAVEASDGLGVVVAHDDFDEATVGQLEGLVDGVVETAPARDRVRVQTHGLAEGESDWATVDLRSPREIATAARSTAEATEVPDSLRAVIEAFESDRPTLTVCNYDGPPHLFSDVAAHFERRDVTVREAPLDAARPRNAVLLHRGDDLLAATSLTELHSAITVDEDSPFEGRVDVLPEAFRELDRTEFGARSVDKAFLTEVSHTIESIAWHTGAGTIRAGFQRLSRLWGDERTRRIYDRLADAGVDCHAYGLPDADPPEGTALTVHGTPAEEILSTWFVVFDGAGRDERKGALLVEEREPERYHGFWTYDPATVDGLAAYFDETYGETRLAADD